MHQHQPVKPFHEAHMDPNPLFGRNVTQDLLAKTEIDAQIALDTLLENINSASLITLVRPDVEFLAKAVPDLSNTLDPLLNMDSFGQIKKLQEAEERIWNGVTTPGARGSGERVSWTRRLVNGILGVLGRLVGDRQARPVMAEEEQREAVIRAGRISHILLTSEALENSINKGKDDPITSSQTTASGTLADDYEHLKNLLHQVELVSKFTRLWAVYEIAWRQHIDDGTPLAEAIKAGDAVIHSLYDRISLNQQLRLRVPGQQLVTVFYESRVLTRVSDFPVQYIVAPYWGHKLIWNWLAFAHEIGHHAWVNVGEETDGENISGLSIRDELFVHLTAYLLSETSSDERVIWSKWMEEMFADLFCLLFIGPAAIHSMLHMFFALPPQGLNQRLKLEDPKGWLRQPYDDEHPIPHLRVYLNLDALELMDSSRFASEIEAISKQWKMLFGNSPGKGDDDYKFSSGKPISVERMRKIGRGMLDIMLNMPLYALGRKTEPNGKLTMREAFFDGDSGDLEQKINKAQATLQAGNWEECKTKLSDGEFEIRHLLAALQFEFERLTSNPSVSIREKSLQDLSSKIIGILKTYGEERLLQQLREKKQAYFRSI